ncbi:hypothetical protein DFA_04927 [Cavenderia fasciculata]|uniref:Transmembrane protein n=1 Tax=Cavenderia fasciculata TaxID=261658 RepID=F4PME7_CACFS|nr:uncharacterized protein DFA_04927 [Cavenderia fasciculata]EGG22797.1 hypothetical protein DFA_04927 [Cavenderia fasciculata]|eukprot:XP_004360648.1 hypothetical protein DFA_04927 [Cavenderia fasciculata]
MFYTATPVKLRLLFAFTMAVFCLLMLSCIMPMAIGRKPKLDGHPDHIHFHLYQAYYHSKNDVKEIKYSGPLLNTTLPTLLFMFISLFGTIITWALIHSNKATMSKALKCLKIGNVVAFISMVIAVANFQSFHYFINRDHQFCPSTGDWCHHHRLGYGYFSIIGVCVLMFINCIISFTLKPAVLDQTQKKKKVDEIKYPIYYPGCPEGIYYVQSQTVTPQEAPVQEDGATEITNNSTLQSDVNNNNINNNNSMKDRLV